MLSFMKTSQSEISIEVNKFLPLLTSTVFLAFYIPAQTNSSYPVPQYYIICYVNTFPSQPH